MLLIAANAAQADLRRYARDNMTKAFPYVALFGEALPPSKVESETDLVFKDKHEVGDIRDVDGKPYEEGYALLEAPQELDGEKQIEWLLDAVLRHRKHLGSQPGMHGKFHVTYAYDSQCNLEYEPEFIEKLSKTGLALTISCYEDETEFNEEDAYRDRDAPCEAPLPHH